MANKRVVSRKKPDEVMKLAYDLPDIIHGLKPDQYNLFKIFWGAVANSLFTSISQAFIEKSEGNVDELRQSWEDLTPAYKAYGRPLTGKSTTSEVQDKYRRRAQRNRTSDYPRLGLLTPGEISRWKHLFAALYHTSKDEMGDFEAKEFAAQVAWTRLKQSGAKTKMDVYGSRKLKINRLSDRLLISLSPGKFDPSVGYKKRNSNQVFELTRSGLKIGTAVSYAGHVDKMRELWPRETSVWMDRAYDAGRDAVTYRLQQIVA